MRAYLTSVAFALLALATPALAQTPEQAATAPAPTAPSVPNRAAVEQRVGELLQQEMGRCWRGPTDQPEPERLVVTVEFTLNADGSLNGQPRVTSPSNYTFDPSMTNAVQAALSAVRDCAPYAVFADDALLRDHHDAWREVSITFSPLGARAVERRREFNLSELQELVSRNIAGSGQARYVSPPETIEEEVAYELRMHMARCREQTTRTTRRIPVVLAFGLNRDGTIRGRPRVVSPENYQRDRETRAAVERTINELRQCAPFPFATHPNLANRYDLWDRITLRLGASVTTPEEN